MHYYGKPQHFSSIISTSIIQSTTENSDFKLLLVYINLSERFLVYTAEKILLP